MRFLDFMSTSNNIKLFPIFDCALQSWNYVKNHKQIFVFFVVANFLLLVLGLKILGGMGSLWFVFWCAGYYWFTCLFFRFYFGRKPFFFSKKVFDSLVPSTKILFMTLALATLLAYLPFLPLFLGLPVDVLDEYTVGFIQQYVDENKIYDVAIQFLLLFMTPVIFFRPMYAWVSSVIGRSGSLRNAWRKTKGNYWRFFLVALVCNVAAIVLGVLDLLLTLQGWGELLGGACLIMFANLYLAKSYEFFFLEVDAE